MIKAFKGQFGKSIPPQLAVWLGKIAIAGSLTIAIHLVFVFIKYGNIIRTYHFSTLIELIFTFFYFLTLFWIYPSISRWISSSLFTKLSPVVKNIVEGITVVVSTFFLSAMVKILPMWLVMLYFNAQMEKVNMAFDLAAMRKSLIIHAVLGLLFYYFVERERIRKEIKAEHIRYAKLQREEFRNQLENLKNQVNPDFLFTSLNTLDELIASQPEKAVEFVNHLSFVYRSFLDHKEEMSTLASEVEVTEAYINILKAGWKDKVEINLQVDSKYLSWQLPSGSLQAIVENAFVNRGNTQKQKFKMSIFTDREKVIFQLEQQQDIFTTVFNTTIQKISERYRYLTDETLEIMNRGQQLIIELPLLQVEEYTTDIQKED